MVAHRRVSGRLAALLMVAGVALAGCTGQAPAPPPGGQTLAPAPSPAAAPSPTAALTATGAPPTATPLPAPTSAPPTSTPAPTAAPATPAPAAVAALASELLFLREGVLVAADPATRAERRIAEGVSDFAATRDGAQIALVRGDGLASELWLVARDGSGLRRITSNDRAEATPAWAPDGLTLAYASSSADTPYRRDWMSWREWCAASEVRKIDLPAGTETTLAAGCDPLFSPDGRRIAYAAPPASAADGVNSLRLINRQGQNGWDFAKAVGLGAPGASGGVAVYAPAWSPDGAQVAYQRFVGTQVETDINLSEIGASFKGQGKPLASGAGWLLPAAFAPDGRTLIVTANNYGDPRGFGGYDAWSAAAIRLEGSRDVALPSGSQTMIGTELDDLARAQRAVWSPDGAELAVQLPPGWRPGLPANEPLDPGGAERLGEIWRWRPGAQPEERLVADVDFASPLAWLPALSVYPAAGYALVAPAGWQLAAPSEPEQRTAVAPDGLRLISAAPYAAVAQAELGAETAARMLPLLVAAGGKDEPPIAWPDGSVYREFSGAAPDGAPVAGATRIVRRADGSTIACLFRSTPERWPLDRALAQALLARCGPGQ